MHIYRLILIHLSLSNWAVWHTVIRQIFSCRLLVVGDKHNDEHRYMSHISVFGIVYIKTWKKPKNKSKKLGFSSPGRLPAMSDTTQLDTVRHSYVYNTCFTVAALTTRVGRDFCLPHLHSTPPLGGSQLEYCHNVWCGKLVWCGYPTVKKMLKISNQQWWKRMQALVPLYPYLY